MISNNNYNKKYKVKVNKMIKYYCEACDSYISDIYRSRDLNSNKCNVCMDKLKQLEKEFEDGNLSQKEYSNKTREINESQLKMEKTIFWCEHCKIPLFDEECSICGNSGKSLSTDIRPVFPEEQLLLDVLSDSKYNILNQSVWYTGGNQFVVNGETLSVTKKDLQAKSAKEVIKKLDERENEITYEAFNDYIKKFVKANQSRMYQIETESMNYIKRVSKDYEDDEMFISFSGGKDSTVTFDIVNRTLSDRNVIAIFGNTTLEFKYTYDYIKNFKENNPKTLLLEAKNKEDDFYEIVDTIGPPSQVMSWCCTFFKTGPISDRIDRLIKKKNKILSFQGIRRPESVSRSKYDRDTDSPKIAKQKVSAPIIDWLDFDVWLYLLTRNVDFNNAYRLGYSRVGCWCCPNNTGWDMFLSEIYMSESSSKFNNMLYDFAIKTNKSEPKKYVEDGSWKARQGGNGLEISENTVVDFKPCVDQADTISYELKRPISDDLYDLFIPFGKINKNLGNKYKGEVYVLDKNDVPIMKLQGRIGTKILKITVYSFNFGGIADKVKNMRDAKSKISCQIAKYQICVSCGGCESTCKYNAITIKKDKKSENRKYIERINYSIDSKKCVRCGDCIDHYQGGCYMKKVLRIKKGE
jgi:phosphoadenosine phosphosulfate reductase